VTVLATIFYFPLKKKRVLDVTFQNDILIFYLLIFLNYTCMVLERTAVSDDLIAVSTS